MSIEFLIELAPWLSLVVVLLATLVGRSLHAPPRPRWVEPVEHLDQRRRYDEELHWIGEYQRRHGRYPYPLPPPPPGPPNYITKCGIEPLRPWPRPIPDPSRPARFPPIGGSDVMPPPRWR